MKRPSPPTGIQSSGDGEEEELILPTKSAASTSKSEPAGIAKKAKLASIFQPRPSPNFTKVVSTDTDNTPNTNIRWLSAIGSNKTCLHGVFGDPKPSSKVAFFDLDGTIVRPKGSRQFASATDELDYRFNLPNITSTVAKIQQQHRHHGFAIVIITNQKQSPDGRNADSPKPKLVTWKKKLGHIARAIGVPIRVFAALGDDTYRKPMLGSWHEFCQHWNGGLPVDMKESFFVGDAAGRSGPKDHNDTDYKWALNAGLTFYTPEEYFLSGSIDTNKYKLPPKPWQLSPDVSTQTTLKGLVADPLDEMVPVTKANLSSTVRDRKGNTQPEIVLFVGPPASGKTTFYKKVFGSPSGDLPYVHINQDILRTRQKCLQVVEATVTGSGLDEPKSCVVDNTNRDRATRKLYIDLAHKLGVGIRCVYFSASWALCIHNSYYRALGVPTPADEPVRDLLPYTAFQSFFRDVQLPTSSEGFPKGSIFIVNWAFEGTDEQRRVYEQYHF